LQLATFANGAAADAAVGALRRDGIVAEQIDKGRTVVLVGPVPSYQQILTLKNRYAATYPDAVIVP
jgi:hypothetical protein